MELNKILLKMAKKSDYKCTLYEKGDKVKSRFKNLFDTDIVLEIEDTELKYVGIFPTQFLKFKGKSRDITDLSNYYEPTLETIEKYKDGFKYFDEVKVKIQEKAARTGVKVYSGFKRGTDNTLTEDDLKFKIIKKKIK
jgi:hypothetical protein